MGLEDLDISRATARGRRPEPVRAVVARELTPDDLVALSLPGTGQPQPSIQSLRTSHHNVARLLAQGGRDVDVSRITGYTTGRIQQLKADPGFQELLAYYQGLDAKRYDEAREDIVSRLKAITVDSIEIMHERLLDNPKAIEMKDLRALAELGLDRIGHGKQSTQHVTTTHSIDEEQLARIKADIDSPAKVSEEDRQALTRLALLATEPYPLPSEAEGEQGAGDGLREEGREGTSDAARTVIHLSPVDQLPSDER